MPAFSTGGDRLILPSGRVSRLKKPSWPWDGSAGTTRAGTLTDGRTLTFRQIAVEQPWISVAVNGKSRQIARLPLKVFRRLADDSRERDRDGDAARRLARPGLRRSPTDLKYSIACGLLIDGNHVEEKVTNADGTPGLRALDWRWTTPFVLDNDVIGWRYTPPDSEERLIDVDDVIHFRWSGYKDAGPLGVSPLEHLGVTVRNEDAAQRFAETNLRNGGRSGVVIQMQPEVKADQLRREGVREEYEARYMGIENVGRPLVTGGGVADVKQIGAQSPVEAVLIDQRFVNREEILAVYDWPQPIAGDLRHATYSNVAELAKLVFKHVLPPWTGLIQEQITVQLIGGPDPTEHYAEFDFNDALRGDLVQRMSAYKQAIANGILTLNDVRELENRPRFDSELADEPLVPANNLQPLDQLVQNAAAVALGQGENPNADPGGRPEVEPGEAPSDRLPA